MAANRNSAAKLLGVNRGVEILLTPANRQARAWGAPFTTIAAMFSTSYLG
ncbi:MAG: hypothetical protein ACRDGN_13900 [bacterium]